MVIEARKPKFGIFKRSSNYDAAKIGGSRDTSKISESNSSRYREDMSSQRDTSQINYFRLGGGNQGRDAGQDRFENDSNDSESFYGDRYTETSKDIYD